MYLANGAVLSLYAAGIKIFLSFTFFFLLFSVHYLLLLFLLSFFFLFPSLSFSHFPLSTSLISFLSFPVRSAVTFLSNWFLLIGRTTGTVFVSLLLLLSFSFSFPSYLFFLFLFVPLSLLSSIDFFSRSYYGNSVRHRTWRLSCCYYLWR